VSHSEEQGPRLSRRRLLAWAGGLAITALVPGCGRDGAGSDAAPTSTEASTPTGTSPVNPDCVLAPELTEGPYYLDLDKVRRDITEGRPGIKLDLAVNVVEADACEPIKDAAVDVWHCDAGGEYSGVEGNAGTFLRGIQMTDANGRAEFRTIYPGWYPGRAVHIHVKVHLGASETYTGQLFFDAAVTQAVYEASPYNARPGPDVTNEADGIFGGSGGVTILAVRPGDPYRGEVTLGVARA
jgi:protocatechuate 3,4-dioxygenase beta subunit